SWIASTIFGVHYSLRNFRICQTVLRRRLQPTFYRQISLLAKEKPVEGSPLFLLQMCMEQLVAIGKI
ncbi:hypothetical protein ODV90_12980, partial [Escherichia coli]|nr:hypothetical protein [Escherichia coli]